MNSQGGAELAIVELPTEIDVRNAEEVRDLLVGAAVTGVTLLVADLTNTTFCDSSGFREMISARKKLAIAGVGMRLALPDANVRRVMQTLGLEQVLSPYPSVFAAIGRYK
ncbi:MAG: STAS domain-containing protein [Streptosporangiaceae bacterium]